MSFSDPLGDMLTRIRNGQRAKMDSVLSPASKLRANVLEVLQREGYIRGYSEDETGKHKALRIFEAFFDTDKEGHGFFAIDDAVIIRKRQIHHRTNNNLATNNHRAFLNFMHTKNAGLRCIQDWRGHE